jgi:hypothetical protein
MVLGGLVVVAVCYKVFTDPAVNNYIGYAFLVAVILCALPTIQNFSYKGSLGEISGQLSHTVAGQSASLGGDINEVSKKVDLLVAKLNANAEASAALGPNYRKNKAYEIFVYYNTASSSTAAEASQIRDFLLDAGYKSTSINTDFSELGSSIPAPGSVWMVYTKDSTALANSLREQLRKKYPHLTKIGDNIVEKMNTADVQIRLF